MAFLADSLELSHMELLQCLKSRLFFMKTKLLNKVMLNLKHSLSNAVAENLLVLAASVLLYRILVWLSMVEDSQKHSKVFGGWMLTVDFGFSFMDDECLQIFHTNKADC